MLALTCSPLIISRPFQSVKFIRTRHTVVVCAAKGPRPRYPRVWKTKRRIGTISKSAKLVQCIKGLSNVKEEVYGALDSFIAWELEFPLITVKKALKTLENQKDWQRIIQVTKWMLSKGQGKTMGSYFTLLNALAEDGRLVEAEELWTKLLMENLESLPRVFFDKMISIYYQGHMHEKMFEVFADMEELGVRPSVSIVSMVGNVFQELGMLDKYEKLHRKYPPPKWEYRYIKGKRVRIKVKDLKEYGGVKENVNNHEETEYGPDINRHGDIREHSDVLHKESEQTLDVLYEENELNLDVSDVSKDETGQISGLVSRETDSVSDVLHDKTEPGSDIMYADAESRSNH